VRDYWKLSKIDTKPKAARLPKRQNDAKPRQSLVVAVTSTSNSPALLRFDYAVPSGLLLHHNPLRWPCRPEYALFSWPSSSANSERLAKTQTQSFQCFGRTIRMVQSCRFQVWRGKEAPNGSRVLDIIIQLVIGWCSAEWSA
jgi:hypothetical protein